MFIQITRFVFILAAAVGGYQLAQELGSPSPLFTKNTAIILYMIQGAAIGYVLGGVIGRRLVRLLDRIEDNLQSMPLADLALSVVGLLVGLVIAFLITLPLALIEIPAVRLVLTVLTYGFLAWLGARLGTNRRDDLRDVIKVDGVENRANANPESTANKLIDTNIIIDGRIVDLMRTGFIDGRLILPRFVLDELQAIADSEDDLRRARGRRGLEVMGQLQEEFGARVALSEVDYADIRAVDSKLIRLARELGGAVLTNDYNLSKVAALEGVRSLNINDLAAAVKVVVLPGEAMTVKIIRQGKEPGQGVGYLADGTMVVVEDGAELIGQATELIVTSVLQTPAGRMIFTKTKTAGRL